MAKAQLRTWAEISRQAIAENFREVRQAVGPGVECAAVVKADAYGHGAAEVSRLLVAEGAKWLAVAGVDEGAALRQAGIQTRILTLSDFLPFEREALLEYDLTPVIHTLADLAALNQLASRAGRILPYHLKLDTGLGRLGVEPDCGAIARAVGACPNTRLEGIMTHLASASDFTTTQTADQVRMFLDCCGGLKEASIDPPYVHLSATLAIAYGLRGGWKTMARPGLAIYGYVSGARGEPPERLLQVRPALTWKAAVLAVKDVPAGTLVGYNALFRAPVPMRIAVLSAGYADGYPHRLTNTGRVIVNGKYAPVLGAVSMDMITIDVSASPEVRPGDSATLLGSEGEASYDAQDMARDSGAISYSILCGITARVKRVYV